ncbi:PUA-like domain-containing protein [Aspergillus crustosus]
MEDVTSPHSSHGDSPSPSSRCATPSFTPSESPEPSIYSVNSLTTPPHTVIRLIQCSRCSLPLRTPLRLPCGDTLCRNCLPPIRPRTGVSYPASEDRKRGFTCSWEGGGCGADHCLGDCGADVLLIRLVGIYDEALGAKSDDSVTATGAGNFGHTISWGGRSDETRPNTDAVYIGSDVLTGVYGLVKRGQLGCNSSNVHYEPDVRTSQGYTRALDRMRTAVRNELDCQVCYSLILDPLTTPCGHTFCRSCLAMAITNSNLCPTCRRKLNMNSSVRSEQINKRLSDIIEILLPEEVASRRADMPSDIDISGEGRLPLAVVSLAFPTMPIGLHIFEARYRLMIQRVMESRGRKFGMILPNRRGRLQPGIGRAPFMQYGTILAVNRYELLPDGRSLIIATGTSRFKVLSWELVDSYHVGRIQRVDDVSISEEEAQESRETMAVAEPTGNAAEILMNSMSTQQLFQLALDFVLKERRQGAPWLHPRVLLAYGALPTDPALFPWWLATILPNWDEEKYSLLETTTVRQRLKITARWVKRLESRQWFSRPRPPLAAVL